MNRNDTVETVKKAGYTVILTGGGPVPIDQWQPYGASKNAPDHMVSINVIGFEFFENADPPYVLDVVREGSRTAPRRWPVGRR